MGGAKAQSEGVFLQIKGTRLTCEASDLGAFKLLCEVYEKITEEYIGSETTAVIASKAAEGVRASGLDLITGTPPACVLPAPEFEEMCVEIDKVQDTEKAALQAAKAMVASLRSVDRFSFLYTPQEWQSYLDRTGTTRIRLGFELRLLEADLPCTVISISCQPVIMEIYSGGPADQAGLQVGDVLLELDGELPSSWSCEDLFHADLFSEGTTVTVRVRRGTQEVTADLQAVSLAVPLARGRVFDPNIGYLRLDSFLDSAGDSVAAALQELLNGGVTRLVLDLRHNPGGDLGETVAVAGLFLPSDSVVIEWRAKTWSRVYRTSRAPLASDSSVLPMVVTTNGWSASASEVLMGALSDHDRATAVGKTTYGKNTGQSVISLEDDFVLRITSGQWTTLAGRSAAPDGFPPDAPAALSLCLHPDEVARRALTAAGLVPPVISGPDRVDYLEGRIDPVASFSAEDPLGRSVDWSLSGVDADHFVISDEGALKFAETPDHEDPVDSGRDNNYAVTVEATNRSFPGAWEVTVVVTNRNETGTVFLPSTPPRVGIPVTAALDDPDGSLSNITWTWERSSDLHDWSLIDSADSATYTPAPGDVGQFLRAAASYTDGEGPDQAGPTSLVDRVASSAALSLSVSSSQVSEGGSSTVQVATDGDTVGQDLIVELRLSGTAVKGSDYTITPGGITIGAGSTLGAAVISALDDGIAEPADTVVIEARDGGFVIGTATVTISASAARSKKSTGGGGGGGSSEDGADEAPLLASDAFEDVSTGVWYESAITWMILHRVTSGCTPTMFCPDANLLRQQFVTFLWRAAGQPTSTYLGSEAFSDVPEGVYSDQAIGWAVSNGVTRGCTQGQFGDPDWRFCPEEPVTRGQMATLLYRHVEAEYLGQAPVYTDVEPGSYYESSVVWLTDFQVVSGCNATQFCPNRNATRAEAAAFINGVAIRPHTWGEGNTSFIPQPK